MLIETSSAGLLIKFGALVASGFALGLGLKLASTTWDRSARFLSVHNPHLLEKTNKKAEEILAATEGIK